MTERVMERVTMSNVIQDLYSFIFVKIVPDETIKKINIIFVIYLKANELTIPKTIIAMLMIFNIIDRVLEFPGPTVPQSQRSHDTKGGFSPLLFFVPF